MKRLLTLVVGLGLCASAASAAVIGVFGENQGLTCYLVPTPGLVNIYILEKYSVGSLASEFKVDDQSGMTHIADVTTSPFLTIGDYRTGISVAYTDCVVGDFVIATMTYFYSGTPVLTCSNHLDIVEDPTPAPPVLGVVDCGYNLLPAHGEGLSLGGPACGACQFAVKTGTWGSVKALYH
jgi:hypothetical protein